MSTEAWPGSETLAPELEAARGLIDAADRAIDDEPRLALSQAEEARSLLGRAPLRLAGRVLLLARALIVIGTCRGRISRPGNAVGFLTDALELLGPLGDPEIRARALMELGGLLSVSGDADAAIARIGEGLELADFVEDPPPLRARLLNSLGGAYMRKGAYEDALEPYEKALEVWRELGDRSGEARVRSNMAVAWQRLGANRRAIETQLDVLAIRREEGDLRGLGITLHGLANTFGSMGSHAEALSYAESALRIAQEIGDREGEAATHQLIAETHACMGKSGLAGEHVRCALAMFREFGCPAGEAHCHATSAKLRLEAGDRDGAREEFEQVLAIARTIDSSYLAARALLDLAGLHLDDGRSEDALELLLEAEALVPGALPRDADQVLHERLHQAYAGVGRMGEALKHFRRYHELVLAQEREDHDQRLAELRAAQEMTEQQELQDRLAASEKVSALGLLVSGVAHELNNPMTGVLGFSELLLRSDELSDRSRRQIERIHQEAGRGRKIVQNLLGFARHREPEMRVVDINQAVQQVLEIRSYEMRVSNIAVVTNFGAELPPVLGDPHQLQQVFLNIVHNAEQAMADAHGRGRLEVRTSCDPDARLVEISFRDDGPGMTRGEIRKIFEPFFTTKPEGKGAGLGLAISQRIVSEHGGEISVESPNGRGAEFRVTLPVSPGDLQVEKPSPATAFSGLTERKCILVVDDEPFVVELVRETLEAAGHSVIVAFDGRTAVDRIARGPCDAVICDRKMPGMSGIDVYRHLRKNRPDLASRFILMTGSVVSTESRRPIDGTFVPQLPKPFHLDQLEEAVRALFG